MTGAGQESSFRIFSVEPHLDGVTAAASTSCCARPSASPRATRKLQRHQIKASHHFRDGMLDLQASVHFQEIERAGLIQQELDRPGADIADGACGLDCSRSHSLAQLRRHGRAGRFLDHLLVATLDRAVPFAEMDHSAVAVRKYLDLDVPRPDDGFLKNEIAIAKGVLRLGSCCLERGGKIPGLLDQPHAAPAAAGCGLDHDGIADLCGRVGECLLRLILALIAGHAGHACLDHPALGARLVAHDVNGVRRRPDKCEAGFLHCFREPGVLGEEARSRDEPP